MDDNSTNSKHSTRLSWRGVILPLLFCCIMVLTSLTSYAGVLQDKYTVTGTVTDANGEGLPGVTVQLKDKMEGTVTALDGSYTLEVSYGDVMVFSMVGFQLNEILCTGSEKVDVLMEEDVTMLDAVEIVSTGYQEISVNKLTGSTENLVGANLEKKGRPSILLAVEGQVAGLGISADPTEEGKRNINIRGISTLQGTTSPLIVVDGFQLEGDISTVNPYEIESVTVLKDGSAASIYGARAANGVIVITTKKGQKGSMKINYTNNFTFSQMPDLDYRLNKVTSSDMVDAEALTARTKDTSRVHSYKWFIEDNKKNPNSSTNPNPRLNHSYARSKVQEIIILQKEGKISKAEADRRLSDLKKYDNINDLRDTFMQKPYLEQHNLSVSGGSDKSTFRSSLNYSKTKGQFFGDKSDRLTFDIVNGIKVSDRVNVDLQGNVSMTNAHSIPFADGFDEFGSVNFLKNVSPYEKMRDSKGNPLPITLYRLSRGYFGGKDSIEMNRLKALGLFDESFYPVKELGRYSRDQKGLSIRLQSNINARLFDFLTATGGFQYEVGNNKEVHISSPNSYEMRALINNAAPFRYSGDKSTLNIPFGARIRESRTNQDSYTLRGQLNFNKVFNEMHEVLWIGGSEIRQIRSFGTGTDRFGYDETSLLFVPVNNKLFRTGQIGSLSDSTKLVNHPDGRVRGLVLKNTFDERINRFFSVYTNAIYTFDGRYSLSGSMRIDQSNLFGTDPRYRYKPFWSVGAKWRLGEESFFEGVKPAISKLDLRVSYGINGNISNQSGPFNIAQSTTSFRANTNRSLVISIPSTPDLRWERTSSTNIGVDLGFVENRFLLSVDFYQKKTTDLLAAVKADPTQGFLSSVKNDASITNKGVDLSLNTLNINSNDFKWNTKLTFRYNKNVVDKVFFPNSLNSSSVFASKLRNVEGSPVNSFFVYKNGGLSKLGNMQVINKEGKSIEVYDSASFKLNEVITKDDLIFAGTYDPIYTAALSNNISYKGISLYFMFIYNGGHKLLKDTYSGQGIGNRPGYLHKDSGKAWKKAGDEKNTNIVRVGAYVGTQEYKIAVAKYNTDNVIAGDYLRLREVILTYTFSQKLLEKLPFANFSINARVLNSLLFTKNKVGIDPEAHSIGERYSRIQPSYSFGVNVGF